MAENPLHPFELHCYVDLSLFGFNVCLNKAVIMMWIVVVLAAALLIAAGSSRRLVPTKLQSLAEMLIDFIRGIILDTIGKDGMRFFPFIASLFLFILFCNLLGMIPGSYTVTSQIVVTASFALIVYGMSIVVGLALHGFRFLSILVPSGTPGWLLPLMIPIEVVSQLARPFSLAVRLFANMTAGHTVLAVLFGMVISIPLIPLPIAVKIFLFFALVVLVITRQWIVSRGGSWGLVLWWFSIPILLSVIWVRWLPFAFSIAINGLEVLIAIIQAYIFTILTCVYLGDAVNLHGHGEHAH